MLAAHAHTTLFPKPKQTPQGYNEEMTEQQRHHFLGTPLRKYARANVLDYGDEFPRLPNDVNPLNPGRYTAWVELWGLSCWFDDSIVRLTPPLVDPSYECANQCSAGRPRHRPPGPPPAQPPPAALGARSRSRRRSGGAPSLSACMGHFGSGPSTARALLAEPPALEHGGAAREEGWGLAAVAAGSDYEGLVEWRKRVCSENRERRLEALKEK